MSLLGHIVIQIAVNAMALLAADYFISGVYLRGEFIFILQLTAIIAAFNIFLKPVLHFILGPFIILTLGFFILVINAALLWLAAYFVPGVISFATAAAFVKTVLVFSASNFVISLVRRAK